MICSMPRCGERADVVATRGVLATLLCERCGRAIESGFGVAIRRLRGRVIGRRGA